MKLQLSQKSISLEYTLPVNTFDTTALLLLLLVFCVSICLLIITHLSQNYLNPLFFFLRYQKKEKVIVHHLTCLQFYGHLIGQRAELVMRQRPALCTTSARHMTVIKITQSRPQCSTETVHAFLEFIDSCNS